MQAVILAAGVGSRLGALTAGRPKCLIEVAGKPIIQWQLEALQSVGVNETFVVTGHEADQVRAAMAGEKVSFVHNPRFRETNVLTSWMLGCAHLRADHLYLHGDTIFEPELLSRLLGKEVGTVVLSVDRHPCGEEEMKVLVSGDKVTQVSKQIRPESAFGEFTGVLLARTAALPLLRQAAAQLLTTDAGKRMFFEAAVQEVINYEGEMVRWVDISDLRWKEIDYPEDLRDAEILFEARRGETKSG